LASLTGTSGWNVELITAVHPLTHRQGLLSQFPRLLVVPCPARLAGETAQTIGHVERLIEGLLTLASSQERLAASGRVDLAAIVGHVTIETQAVAQKAGVELRTALASAPVAGDPVLLERLAHNLIDNAIGYNLADHGWITVTSGLEDGDAQLTVENSGPTVPADELPGLFEPFRRLATQRRESEGGSHGAGLGLSIVGAVAHAHRGEVHATARPDGGLIIQVRIPALGKDSRIDALDGDSARTSAV
jgi:signal transduction histidine kinase